MHRDQATQAQTCGTSGQKEREQTWELSSTSPPRVDIGGMRPSPWPYARIAVPAAPRSQLQDRHVSSVQRGSCTTPQAHIFEPPLRPLVCSKLVIASGVCSVSAPPDASRSYSMSYLRGRLVAYSLSWRSVIYLRWTRPAFSRMFSQSGCPGVPPEFISWRYDHPSRLEIVVKYGHGTSSELLNQAPDQQASYLDLFSHLTHDIR